MIERSSQSMGGSKPSERTHLPVLPALVDPFARTVRYLRVSVTDRCNYRCTYCMPEQGVDLLPREDILHFEELIRVVRVFVGLGVRRIRLTGGEPTIRRDIVGLVAQLTAIPGLEQVVMTTNGHRLLELAEPLARAGLSGMNVSVDTLDAAKFAHITRRGDLARVLAGSEAARAAGIAPLKLNVVALKGFNDGELGALCDWAWARDIVPRFIEWMPMSSGDLYAPGEFLAAAEIRARIAAHTGSEVVPDQSDQPAASSSDGPARYLCVAGDPPGPGRRKFGVISAISEHFCDTCNRVRLTAVGALHTCLAYDDACDLRSLVRGGATDGELREAIAGAVGLKRRGHEFTQSGCGAPRKHMVSIGG